MADFGQSKAINDGSYRKGLVLGFTLAEVMLLIVFCLLLISGAVIKKLQIEVEKAQQPDPKSIILRIPREKIVYEASAPKPDSTGTIVSLWPVLIDKEKSDLTAKLYGEGQLNADTDEKLNLLRQLSVSQIKELISQRLDPSESQFTIPESVKARLKELISSGTNWVTVIEMLNSNNSPGHRWPPIISLEETKGYAFASGHAEITPEFRTKLANEAVPRILQVLNDYDADIVEIVGHTDSVPVYQREKSNLDQQLGLILQGTSSSQDISVQDNAGLGLARAAAVAEILLSDSRLADAHIVALSAGQLLKPNGDLDFSSSRVGDEKRRRLEIRIRCSTDPCSRAQNPTPLGNQ